MKAFGWIALVSVIMSVALLGLLHILSPEFDPSWRMISEYATGQYGAVLAGFFTLWGVSSLAVVFALRSEISTRSGRVGLILLAIAGFGQILAAIFAIGHPLHDLAGNLAIPAFAIAAVLITKSLRRGSWKQAAHRLKPFAHATWISVVVLVLSFIVLMGTFAASGAPVASDTDVKVLPEGVIALVGWTNRLLVLIFALWTAAVSYFIIKR